MRRIGNYEHRQDMTDQKSWNLDTASLLTSLSPVNERVSW